MAPLARPPRTRAHAAEVKSGDYLEFRKRHRPLKVKTLDDSLKTVIVNESLPVSEVVAKACEKLGEWGAVPSYPRLAPPSGR
jgi:hypothetical protein